ncbi:MAG TPA: acetylglutamate kinase [Enhygromyxa sp.]|nr:acetylglutamate kinase [Enhygromyxa sp.]
MLKFGGEVVAAPEQLATVLGEVAELVESGWRFVVCHGGGPQATELGRQLGLEPIKVAGQRVTDEATLRVVCQALAGEVSCTVVAAARAVGLRALGISAGLISARRRPPVVVASEGGRTIDYGWVGDVTEIDRAALEGLWALGLTPIVNPIGVGSSAGVPSVFNINADTVAAAIAAELAADHLFAVTAVPGVLRDRDDPSTRIPRLVAAEARAAIASGQIAGGMIPKVEEALAALGRTKAVHILAAEPGSLRAEAREPGSRGTVLLEQ